MSTQNNLIIVTSSAKEHIAQIYLVICVEAIKVLPWYGTNLVFHLVPHFEEVFRCVIVMSGFIYGEHLIFLILTMAGLKFELAIK
jgi:hypothetical protein